MQHENVAIATKYIIDTTCALFFYYSRQFDELYKKKPSFSPCSHTLFESSFSLPIDELCVCLRFIFISFVLAFTFFTIDHFYIHYFLTENQQNITFVSFIWCLLLWAIVWDCNFTIVQLLAQTDNIIWKE